MYAILRFFLFRLDAESAHHLTFSMLRLLLAIRPMAWLLSKIYGYTHPSLERELWGLKFRNPVGLAAGFDKDALIGAGWKYLGFGFVEIGTVTPRPQAGNERPRLFRLLRDRAILNRMGFNNAGAEVIAARLQRMDRSGIVIGANIGKNKDTPNEQAAADYLACFETLYPWVDYFVVNVSSPNTPGLRELQEKGPLTALLQALQAANQQKAQPKPLLLKIAPDLSQEQLDDVLKVCRETRLNGLILSNTTLSREGLQTPALEVEHLGPGGISGAPLRARAQALAVAAARQNNGELLLIGVGGIMQPADAIARMQAGVSLLQLYSGYVYAGPALPRRICKALAGE